MAEGKRLLNRLVGDFLARRGLVLLALLSEIGLGGTQLYLTWLIKLWVEGPLYSGDNEALLRLSVLALAALLCGALCLYGARYFVACVNQSYIEILRNRAVARLLAMEPVDIEQRQSGDLLSRFLNDAGVLSGSLSMLFRRATREAVIAFGAIGMLLVLEWRLTLVLALLVPTIVWLLNRFGRVIRRLSREGQEAAGYLGALLSEQLQGFSTIKIFQAEAAEMQRFSARNAAVRDRLQACERNAGLLTTSVFLLTGLALLGLGFKGSQLLASGALSQAQLLAFGLYAAQIIEPLRRLSELQGPLQTALAAASRIYALIDWNPLVAPATVQPPPPLDSGHGSLLQLRKVRAGYRPLQPVLENLSLSIEAGDFVAVVGQSGTGKTTLLRLLVGFQTPWSGELWLWGREQSNLSLTELRRRVTLVEQEPFLFSGPLLDNLIYGHPDASVEQIETAVRKVGLTEVLERLPEGILTPMAEAGRQLSGGERQRLALARALLREPEILVLDEATSALDGRSEASLFEHLGDWLARRTVILVSHRLSTVMLARRALVLGGGRIVDDGPPKSLLATAGPFRDLFASQLSGLKSE